MIISVSPTKESKDGDLKIRPNHNFTFNQINIKYKTYILTLKEN
jgi:hypothetical protein